MTTESADPPGEAVPLREIFGEGGIPTDVMPNFAVVIRGYERHQVDGYVAELLTALEETRANLERVETRFAELTDQAGELSATVTRHQALPAFADLGDHISTMMAAAAEESETMRRRAEAEALETVKLAQEQSNATLRAADERATDIQTKAARLQAEALAAHQRALDDAAREAAAIVADGERRRRETIAAAEALMAAATEEVTGIRATRDLGAEAIDELSGVLARVAAEYRQKWRTHDGADKQPQRADKAAADKPAADKPAADRPKAVEGGPAPRPGTPVDPPSDAKPSTPGPRTPEPADAGRPAAGDTAGAPDTGDDTVTLINLDVNPPEPAEKSPSPTPRVL